MRADLPVGMEPVQVRECGRMPVGIGAIVILSAMIVAALAGVLGGRPSVPRTIENPSVTMSVQQPHTIRSGMFFESRIELIAREPLDDATIGMTPSLWRSITINTTMPQPSEEEFSEGSYRLHFGKLEPGERIVLKLDAQINPDLFGGTRGIVSAHDGDRVLATMPINLRVLP